ncbi:MAG: type I glyceraldehyde-3-phosphate dehydrogenase [candidate division WOR-3 bacterium]|nr:type I glyceraldehyde-3-phosphate dehydrogenase [candidate division WOR-3 bacterium]MCX7947381.1 type I glyceraldehyde-3-phosphate dehydrogenase [candidate division WOR-3 bacterium]MDW8150063.1 type I glyceraldehyde-3-phosphate dehydrogenase [candidate division WOR-3 bacterium]
MIKVGINGFGRIGREVFKIAQSSKNLEIVAINDITDAKTLAHLLKYDSIYGIYKADINYEGNELIVDGKRIKVYSFQNPSDIPWQEHNIEIVVEASGKFTDKENAIKHLRGSVKKVIITAPGKKEDITIVLGANEHQYDPQKHHIISNASCTTNAFALMVKVLHENFTIEKGLMTTVHSYTNDQRVLDLAHKDLRRARAAGLNIIPTSTGAANTIFKIYPELEGKIDAISLRVPTPTVSIVDFAVILKKKVTKEEINQAFKSAQNKYIGYTEEPLVSSDFIGDERSVIVDGGLTQVVDDNFVKVFGWYDNEWGYSRRVVDLIEYIISKTY